MFEIIYEGNRKEAWRCILKGQKCLKIATAPFSGLPSCGTHHAPRSTTSRRKWYYLYNGWLNVQWFLFSNSLLFQRPFLFTPSARMYIFCSIFAISTTFTTNLQSIFCPFRVPTLEFTHALRNSTTSHQVSNTFSNNPPKWRMQKKLFHLRV